jgi:hypothetical protein
MDLSVFRLRLSALGADIGRWPDGDEAVALLADSDEAVALLADALRENTDTTQDSRDFALTDAVLDATLGRNAD